MILKDESQKRFYFDGTPRATAPRSDGPEISSEEGAILRGETPAPTPAPAEHVYHPMMQPTPDMTGRLTDWASVVKYLFAGNATLTLKSRETRTRFTYRVTQAKSRQTGKREGKLFFISVLTGENNESDFSYAGTLNRGTLSFRFTSASRVTVAAPSMTAWCWFVRLLQNATDFEGNVKGAYAMPEKLEIWHDGRCGRCGRKLTVPESVASGFGPECAGKVGL